MIKLKHIMKERQCVFTTFSFDLIHRDMHCKPTKNSIVKFTNLGWFEQMYIVAKLSMH